MLCVSKYNKLQKSLSKLTEDESSKANLKSGDLSPNNPQVWHTFVLKGFSLLITLNISLHNYQVLPSCHELDLSHNQMTEVFFSTFKNLSIHLDIIRFDHNMGSYSMLESIHILYFSHNPTIDHGNQ